MGDTNMDTPTNCYDAFGARTTLSAAAVAFKPGHFIHSAALGAAGPIVRPDTSRLQPTEVSVLKPSTLASEPELVFQEANVLTKQTGGLDGELTVMTSLSRHLIITHVKVKATSAELTAIFNTATFPSLQFLDTRELGNDHVYVNFFDLRDAVRAYELVQIQYAAWVVHYIKPRSLITLENCGVNAMAISNHEGCIIVTIRGNVTVRETHTILENMNAYGPIKAFAVPGSFDRTAKEFVIEYFDTRDALHAINDIPARNGQNSTFWVSAAAWHPDVLVDSPPRSAPSIGSSNTSPIRPSTVSYNEYNVRANGSQYLTPPDHDPVQNVHLASIAAGQDVRTTVMIRNIPEQVTKRDLQTILNSIVFGKYDFMYLRINFETGLNVGYAFINMPDPMDIIDLARGLVDQRWSRILHRAGIWIQMGRRYNRSATMSYATIQGRDCLVQKFRNSNIMVEPVDHRPMLLVPGPGPLAGHEDSFPEPDNISKFQRSCDNAGHVGLFAPRVGRYHRMQHRNRRSQYERGTTAAEREAHFQGLHDPSRNAVAIQYFMNRQPPPQLPNFYGY